MFNSGVYNGIVYNGTVTGSAGNVSSDIASGGHIENEKATYDSVAEESINMVSKADRVSADIKKDKLFYLHIR